ncbi:MAG: PP0621 family protein [Burkholderiaceae bacterium]
MPAQRWTGLGVKYLLWAVLLYIGWRWYLSKKSSATSEANPETPSAASSSAAETDQAAEQMVACAQCGIHLPWSESVSGVGQLRYCSDEHRLRHSERSTN